MILNLHFKIILLLFTVLLAVNGAVVKRDFEIAGKIPHNRSSFTQGLIFKDGKIFESTGAPDGRISKLYILNSVDGKVLKETALPQIFAEGLTSLGNTLTVITWRSGIAFNIDENSLVTKGQLSYKGEGWGLTNDETVYIMSNGSDSLYIRDPGFNIIGTVPVKLDGRSVKNLNELEFINGKVWANVWYSDIIYEIDISNGQVISQMDCRLLREKCSDIDKHDVLNGIAYDYKNSLFYITGKDWPWIFKIKVK